MQILLKKFLYKFKKSETNSNWLKDLSQIKKKKDVIFG